jgi:histidinol phosphatase-like enzyme
MQDSLIERLHNDIVEITFDKVDGTRRVMKCTLDEAYIAVHAESREKKENTRKPKEGLLVVFDTEKNDWRSMRVESIVAIR